MPIFEYHCDGCGSRFERIVSGKDRKVVCEQCEAAGVEPLLPVFSAKTGSSNSCPKEAACPGAARHSCGSGSCCCGH